MVVYTRGKWQLSKHAKTRKWSRLILTPLYLKAYSMCYATNLILFKRCSKVVQRNDGEQKIR